MNKLDGIEIYTRVKHENLNAYSEVIKKILGVKPKLFICNSCSYRKKWLYDNKIRICLRTSLFFGKIKKGEVRIRTNDFFELYPIVKPIDSLKIWFGRKFNRIQSFLGTCFNNYISISLTKCLLANASPLVVLLHELRHIEEKYNDCSVENCVGNNGNHWDRKNYYICEDCKKTFEKIKGRFK